MNYLRIVLLTTLLVVAADAASWDGTKGPLTVVTFGFMSGENVLPGVPSFGPAVWHTTIFLKSSDKAITAVRVRIVYRDANGEHSFNQISDLVNSYGGVTLEIKPEQIVSAPVFTVLREGEVYE